MRNSQDLLFKSVFYIILWTIWIAFPFVTNSSSERMMQFHLAMIPVSLTNIPLFMINSEWLIPQIFRKRGIGIYLFCLFLLILTFAVIQLVMKELLVPPELLRHHWDIFWAVIPVLFVTGISTGYGFIYYQLQQNKAVQEAKQEQLKSELSFLRSQISPHFIFNILNSIVYLIRAKSSLAEPVTIRLSELMRYMLYESSDAQVPLDKEIEYLNNYIELQRIRFGEDVDIQLGIDGNIHGQSIEPMLLIPFVENAFKHGVGLIDKPVIHISLQIEDSDLDFMVRNKISGDRPDIKDPDSGIGLKNVKRRLELLYPGFHNLEIKKEQGWFEMTLHLKLTGKTSPIRQMVGA